MGKKKRQSNPCTTVSDTPEQVDADDYDKSAGISNQPKCQHIARSVDPNKIHKNFKSDDIGKFICTACQKKGIIPPSEERWICLQCGLRQCSKEHSSEHSLGPYSVSHALALDLNAFTVWCHGCKVDIPDASSKKLKGCLSSIKMVMEKSQVQIVEPSSGSDDMPPPLVDMEEKSNIPIPPPPLPLAPAKLVVNDNKFHNDLNNYKSNSKKKAMSSEGPFAVRGLINLGNTCFFNSVLQCLARTPNLVDTLRIMESEDQQVYIPLNNGKTLDGKLERSNDALSSVLSETLESICMPGTSANPLKLLSLLRKKCPQFEGYDQHDAHELLRHLLDNVRLADHKRYKALLLREMGLSRKVNPTDVPEDLQKKLKSLDNEVVEKVTLVPDHVFKGKLISTLECQDCRSRSHRVESFLDLSLPITAEKPQPPCIVRRKMTSSPELSEEKPNQSKRQIKREKRHASRMFKKLNNNGSKEETPLIVNNTSDKGESDADVEDNDDNEKGRLESGYSSEKAEEQSEEGSGGGGTNGADNGTNSLADDDSARTSPTQHQQGLSSSSLLLMACEGYPPISNIPHYLRPRLDGKWEPPSVERQSKDHLWDQEVEKNNELNQNCLKSSVYHDKMKPCLSNGDFSLDNFLLSQPGQSPLSPCIRNPISILSSDSNSEISLVVLPRGGNLPASALIKRSNNLTSIVEDEELKQSNTASSQNCDAKVVNGLGGGGDSGDCFDMSSLAKVVDSMISVPVKTEESLEPMDTKEDLPAVGATVAPVDVSEEDDDSIQIVPLTLFSTSDLDNKNTICPPQVQIDELSSEDVWNDDGPKPAPDQPIALHYSPLKKKEEEAPAYANDLYTGRNIPSVKRKDDHVSPSIDDFYNYRTSTYDEAECSIQSCLSQFISIELMSGSNKVGCSNCTSNKGNKDGKTVYTIASKQFLIKEAPQVLILHLKRFQVQLYSFKKLSKHVAFPLTLDLAPFCQQELQKNEEGNLTYRLYGVVEHSGTLNGGHYVAYVKVDTGEEDESGKIPYRWFHISDSHVLEVTENRVLSSQAYLLFYKRFSKQSS